MELNKTRLLIILVFYFIFVSIGMTAYGSTLIQLNVENNYNLTNGLSANQPLDDDITTISTQKESFSFFKSLKVSISNVPFWFSLIFLYIPFLLLVMTSISFFIST